MEDNRVALSEPVGKKSIVSITGQNNTFASKPGTPKEGKKPRPITFDFSFMALGNEPYDPNRPVVCICKRPFELENHKQNTWIANLRTEPKLKKDTTETSQDAGANSEHNDKIEDSRLGITVIYEPYTGRKWFHLSDWYDD